MDSPFLRPNDPRYPEVFADATIHILGAHGIDRFSARAIARWMKVAPPTVLGEYSRAQLLEIVIISFERRWLSWSGSESMYGPSPTDIPLRLPATEDEHLGVRVHLALQQLAESERLRDNRAPAAHLERLRMAEKELLRHRLEQLAARQASRPPNELAVTATMALVSGLRLGLADPAPDLTWSVASAILRDYVARQLDEAGPDGVTLAS